MDIMPLREHALLLRCKIFQVQVKLREEVFKIKQVEARLQEILVVATEFKSKTQDIAETIKGQVTWLETNKEALENTRVKNPERLQFEYDLMNFSNKAAERLIDAVKKTMDKCMEFYKKVPTTHNKFQTSLAKRLQDFPSHEEHLKHLHDRL